MMILSEPALKALFNWLADHLKFELRRPSWRHYIHMFPDDGAILWLYPPSWQFPGIDDCVAFSLGWSNTSDGEPPYVQLYLPAEDCFPLRNQLLSRVQSQLKRAGFTDVYEGEEDPEPDYPLWKSIPLEFNGLNALDQSAALSKVVKGFEDLLAVEEIIDEVVRSSPPPPPACDRELRIIAFLDTEWTGAGSARKMTELAILNVAYDPIQDEIVGIVEKCVMNRGAKLQKERALEMLERAQRIVAHNCSGDQLLLEHALPGIEKGKWACSFRGIDWKALGGVRSASQESLSGKAGLRYKQLHHALADARDLIRLLSQKHSGGRTYLSVLLSGDR